MLLALLVVTSVTLYHLRGWPTRLSYPGDIDCAEGTPFAEITMMARGVPLYAETPGEFHAAIYGPLYYLLGSRVIGAAHPNVSNLRWLSLLALLLVCATSAWLTLSISNSTAAAALAPILILSVGFVSMIGINARSDMVAFCLSLLGLAWARRFWTRDTILLLCVPLLLVSLLYKQQFIAVPAAIFLALILERRFRIAAIFAAALSAGLTAALLIFQFLVFRGQPFLRHYFAYNAGLFSSAWFVAAALLTGLIFAAWYLLAAEFYRRHRNTLLATYLGMSAITCLIALSKVGSGENYYLEPIVALCIPVAALIVESWKTNKDLPAIACLILLVPFICIGERPTAEDANRTIALQNYLAANFSPHADILTVFPGEAIRAGLTPRVSDLFQCTNLQKFGLISDTPLKSSLQQQRFDLLLLDADLRDPSETNSTISFSFNEGLREAALRNYTLQDALPLPAMLHRGVRREALVWTRNPSPVTSQQSAK